MVGCPGLPAIFVGGASSAAGPAGSSMISRSAIDSSSSARSLPLLDDSISSGLSKSVCLSWRDLGSSRSGDHDQQVAWPWMHSWVRGRRDGRRASKGMCAGAGAGTEHFRHVFANSASFSRIAAHRQSFLTFMAVCPTARVGHLRPERAGGAGGISAVPSAHPQNPVHKRKRNPSPDGIPWGRVSGRMLRFVPIPNNLAASCVYLRRCSCNPIP